VYVVASSLFRVSELGELLTYAKARSPFRNRAAIAG
jgi:hypothetical protein